MIGRAMRTHSITGPPCSGKTTHALTHINPDIDILLDVDRIYEALSGQDHLDWHKPMTPPREAALHLRQSLIKWMRTHPHISGTMWLIDTDGRIPTHERTDLNPGADECHRRADLDSRPASTHEQIDAWYERNGE